MKVQISILEGVLKPEIQGTHKKLIKQWNY